MVAYEDLLSVGVSLLRRVDARLVDGELQGLTLVLPGNRSIPVEVTAWEGALQLSRVQEHSVGRGLHIVNRASQQVVRAAEQGGFDLITVHPARVIIDGAVLLDESPGDIRPTKPRGKPPWGRWAVERVLLLTDEPVDQLSIARSAGITPQAVSLVLKEHALAERNSRGWTARPGLLDRWLLEYPGPAGQRTHWYSLAEPTEQATRAAELARELTAEPLVSGDVAADWYAPWRQPTSGLMYVREVIDLTPVGFTLADPADATFTLRLPADRTLWPVATSTAVTGQEIPLADPLIVLWDLTNTSVGVDVVEAASLLRRRIERQVA